MDVITCKNLTLSYENTVAVNNVSFSVADGDYLCVVGENGSGKSTLMKGILGLKSVDGGEILFNGVKQREIGYLPQQSEHQKDFPATVLEVVISGCLNKTGLRPFYNKAEKERAQNAISVLNLDELKNRSYRELSGGQQQRVLLARALCAAEKLLLLDEPVSGLDPLATAEMYDIIFNLNKTQRMTVIMISHDISSSVKYADKILHLGEKNSFFGSVSEYENTDSYKKFAGGV